MRLTPVLVLIVLTLALPIPAMAQSATPAASPSAASGDFAGLVDIGGRKLYLECHGDGQSHRRSWRPATARLAATGGTICSSRTTPRTMVLPGVAEFTRVCTYDRPGTVASIGEDDLVSRSDAIAQPRTAPEVVAELHALLQAAADPRPLRPGGPLAGRLLRAALRRHLPRRGRRPRPRRRLLRAAGDPDAPRALGGHGAAHQEIGTDTVFPIPGYGDVETFGYGADNAVVREAVAASPLPPMPLAVLAHGRPFHPAPGDRAVRVHHRRVGSVPAGELRKSGHPRAAGALLRGHRERPRHPPGSTGAGDRSDPAGGGGRAQPGHLVLT